MPTGKWDPFRDLLTLQDRVNRLFQEGMTRGPGQEDLQAGEWTPAVDISENAEKILLRADLPGLEERDVELRVEDGMLIIRGHRKPDSEGRPENVHRSERPHGTFVRSFSLPTNIEESGIKASLRNGVLEVVLPKTQESKAKAIRIETK